jgi:hypothetical protein
VNRRRFLGQVVLGSAAIASSAARAGAAEQQVAGALNVKFVGMMGYITRSDRSILVAMPGAHPMGHYAHVPFLMARSGSAIANALGLAPMPGVVAGAFDDRLADAPDSGFVFRCLDGCDMEIEADGSEVTNRATQLAQMSRIATGKRLRNDLRRWSNATVTLRGGALENSAAHPDAGKIWSFGTHKQALTDATLFIASAATLRLAAGPDVMTYHAAAGELAQLWVISSAGPRTDVPDPKRLVHGEILFQFFANAEPVTATCEEAEGRLTMATELPCPTSAFASRSIRAVAAMPPHVDLCYGGGWCEPCV